MAKLGVDIGGVIIDRVGRTNDTSFQGRDFIKTPEVPFAAETLKRLVYFFDVIYLVSRCGPETELRTKLWLQHNDFFKKTGIKAEHVFFCRERYQKAEIATKLGLTHFIDDRLEVLGYLINVPNRFLINARDVEVNKHKEFLPDVHRVSSWSELLKELE